MVQAMSGHYPWSDIRERALAGLSAEERAEREARVCTHATEIDLAVAAYRSTCTHAVREPLLPYPDYDEDLHCRECGIHLDPAGPRPSA